jgi:hypothetical protein
MTPVALKRLYGQAVMVRLPFLPLLGYPQVGGLDLETTAPAQLTLSVLARHK